jgi:hypothetical protein
MPRFPDQYTEKTTPVDADNALISDSEDNSAIKRTPFSGTWSYIQSKILAMTGWITTVMVADGAITPAKRSGGFAMGVFNRSTTGDEVISGLGFTPKYIEIEGAFTTANPSNTNNAWSRGWYDGTTQHCIYSAARIVTTLGAEASARTDAVLNFGIINSSGNFELSLRATATIQSDGFTLNFSTASIERRVFWRAFG